MIIIDTNIISELMKPSPSTNVIRWLDQEDPAELYVTTITIAEIAYGLFILPAGNRKQQLQNSFHNALQHSFQHRILSFTESAAHTYGKIMADRKKIGKPMSALDGQIAAIALTHAATLATRNVSDFEHNELNLVNPFS